jgi:DNA repair protein RadC
MKTTYVKSRQITCVSELSPFERTEITTSRQAQEFARKFYHEDIELYESFFLMMLNRANVVTSYAKISQGGTSSTVVDPKIIAKYAVDDLCSSVILVHNHPSGNKEPSQPDKDLTKKVKTGLRMFDIGVLDHIIITKDSYTSFLDEEIL